MRIASLLVPLVLGGAALLAPLRAEDAAADAKMLRALYTAALTTSPAYDNLRTLTTQFPGRLAGSPHLAGAVMWGQQVLAQSGADRTELQPVMVSHWERGAKESVLITGIRRSRHKRRR